MSQLVQAIICQMFGARKGVKWDEISCDVNKFCNDKGISLKKVSHRKMVFRDFQQQGLQNLFTLGKKLNDFWKILTLNSRRRCWVKRSVSSRTHWGFPVLYQKSKDIWNFRFQNVGYLTRKIEDQDAVTMKDFVKLRLFGLILCRRCYNT